MTRYPPRNQGSNGISITLQDPTYGASANRASIAHISKKGTGWQGRIKLASAVAVSPQTQQEPDNKSASINKTKPLVAISAALLMTLTIVGRLEASNLTEFKESNMNANAVKPDDILADTENFTELNGLKVRKGSIAAFLKNIDLFEDPNSNEAQKTAALQMIKELAPAIIAAGLHRHAIFKNKVIEDILSMS
ncbi:MAG: hypothetical protein ACK5O7_02955 [Holosporales bacterium]